MMTFTTVITKVPVNLLLSSSCKNQFFTIRVIMDQYTDDSIKNLTEQLTDLLTLK